MLVEGQTTVGAVQVSDPDGTTISPSLEGPDAALFSLTGQELSAAAPLDFETPADADGDNVYEITINANDGQATTRVNVTVTVTNIPLDGIARISGSQGPSPVGDLTGDGIDDFLIASAEPANVPPGSTDPGYILFRNETIGETPIATDLQFLTTAPGAFRGARQLRATGVTIERFVHGFLPTPAGGSIEYAGLLTDKLLPTANQNFDATILFPDEFSDAFSGPFFIDLTNDSFPPGVRSTRDQVNFRFEFIRPVGDFDGDGSSDAILESIFDPIANNDPAIELTVPVIDGSLARATSAGLFAGVVDLPTQAVTLTFPAARYVTPSSFGLFEFEDYAEPGSADVTGDGIDDFIRLIGLRGNSPIIPSVTPAPQGHEIVVISGGALSNRPKGLNDVEGFAATELFRISIPEAFSSPRLKAIGDVNGDGFADILITTFLGGPSNVGGSQFGAYLVSGQALVQAQNGTVSLADFPGAFGTAIKLSDTNGFDIALISADWIGGPGRDLIFTDTLFINGSPILDSANAIILADSLFTAGFPPLIELSDPDTNSVTDGLAALPADSFARITSPRVNRNFGGPSTDFITAAAIGDGDGDGFRDLAITDRTTILLDPSDPSTAETNFNTYVIPSGRLRAAATSGDIIDLEMEFPPAP